MLCNHGIALWDHRIKHSHCGCSDSAACVRAGAAGRLLQADGYTFSCRLKNTREKMLFLFLERYNIFPCDGQIFISSLSVQTKSGKQAVLAQPSTFPNSSCINVLSQGSLAAAAAPHVQFAGPRTGLYWLQLQHFSIRPRSLPNLKYASQSVCFTLESSVELPKRGARPQHFSSMGH